MIAVYKIQHQCRAFPTDMAQNTVELCLKIEEEIKFPQPEFSLQVKSPRVSPYLMSFSKWKNPHLSVLHFDILSNCAIASSSNWWPLETFLMFHFWFCSPIFNNIPSQLKFCFTIKTQKSWKTIFCNLISPDFQPLWRALLNIYIIITTWLLCF